jgi:hypothetical protein
LRLGWLDNSWAGGKRRSEEGGDERLENYHKIKKRLTDYPIQLKCLTEICGDTRERNVGVFPHDDYFTQETSDIPAEMRQALQWVPKLGRAKSMSLLRAEDELLGGFCRRMKDYYYYYYLQKNKILRSDE